MGDSQSPALPDSEMGIAGVPAKLPAPLIDYITVAYGCDLVSTNLLQEPGVIVVGHEAYILAFGYISGRQVVPGSLPPNLLFGQVSQR